MPLSISAVKSGAVSPMDNIALHLPPPRSGQQPDSLGTGPRRVIVDATGLGIQFDRDYINDNLVDASGRSGARPGENMPGKSILKRL